jgi:hypothetical protein
MYMCVFTYVYMYVCILGVLSREQFLLLMAVVEVKVGVGLGEWVLEGRGQEA